MQKWEYAFTNWSPIQIYLMPPEKFHAQYLQDWLDRTFPQIPQPRIREWSDPKHARSRPPNYEIDRLQDLGESVAMALIQHLGSQGWEAIELRSIYSGGAWFKRPIPESAADTEASLP